MYLASCLTGTVDTRLYLYVILYCTVDDRMVHIYTDSDIGDTVYTTVLTDYSVQF